MILVWLLHYAVLVSAMAIGYKTNSKRISVCNDEIQLVLINIGRSFIPVQHGYSLAYCMLLK